VNTSDLKEAVQDIQNMKETLMGMSEDIVKNTLLINGILIDQNKSTESNISNSELSKESNSESYLRTFTDAVIELEERKERLSFLQSGDIDTFRSYFGSKVHGPEELTVIIDVLTKLHTDRIKSLEECMGNYQIVLRDSLADKVENYPLDSPIPIPVDKTVKFKLGKPTDMEFKP